MTKLIASTIALTMMMPATASAQHRDDQQNYDSRGDKNRKAVVPSKKETRAHKFGEGERFDRSRAVNYRRIDHRESSRLSTPPHGYVWVRAGNDALLVRLKNNIITRLIRDVY